MQEFIDGLNLPYEGKMSGKEYIISVDTSNQYSDLFNAISLNKDLECLDDSIATEKQSEFVYTDGVYEVKLVADFDKDVYKCVISER